VGDDEHLRRALSGVCVGRDTLDPKTLERLRNLGVERIGGMYQTAIVCALVRRPFMFKDVPTRAAMTPASHLEAGAPRSCSHLSC
jgi:hypothetical protein